MFETPEKHEVIIQEMKLEAALIMTNSPYAEVRAVVDCHDDPSLPVSTIRAWVIGLTFSVLLAFVNQLFSVRLATIQIAANVAQLLCYPMGKLWEMTMPDIGFTLFGIRHSLNPGRFNKKEHMLITIMANVAYNFPYTNGIIWVQYLPTFYNQRWASQVGYQLLVALSTNFVGYGMAGVCRRFLVYPSYCVWPSSLVTIALNSAFHSDRNVHVDGPFRRIYRASRLKLFCIAFVAMFVWFFFPSFIWTSLWNFSWISWISPNNIHLAAVTGFNNGVGLNPFPTFDWNTIMTDSTDPLVIPFFSTFSKFIGTFLSMFVILGMWYSNGYNSAYLPINANGIFDNTGARYNVSRAVDDRKLFDPESYEHYSPPFLTAGAIVVYMMFFAIYSSAVTYAYLYHRHEIMLGFRTFIASFRNKDQVAADRELDVHNRLMKQYKEVPEWWYTVVLVLAVVFGIVGIAAYETYTTPGVVFYGLILCAIFVIPVGIIKAMTGIEVPLNVLAEFIGGSIVEGNALAMNYFKTFGFVTCSHAILFSNDLKLAHYLKVPPRFTFWAQIIATLVSTFVCTAVLNFQMHAIPGICTPEAKWRLTCPGANTFFMASVLWGTVGPKKVWGDGGMYTLTLIGFPIGFLTVLAFYFLQKKYPHWGWLRQLHPVAIMYGGTAWAPYNLSWAWPAVPVAWLSWIYVKRRFIGFWSKVCFLSLFLSMVRRARD